MDCCSQPPRTLNKHGGCELCASTGLWLADGCVINHGRGFAGVVPALANDIPPLPITFINNHNSSRIIITETYPGFPSVWKMMNETRAMMNCDKKKWARGSDLVYLQLPRTVQTEILGNVCTGPLPHSSSVFRAGCILSNLVISLISALMWQMHRSSKGVRR